jgi:hypothetical protein
VEKCLKFSVEHVLMVRIEIQNISENEQNVKGIPFTLNQKYGLFLTPIFDD